MAMLSKLEKLRNKQSVAFSNIVNELSNSSRFRKAQNDLSLNGYTFEVISARYVPQIIDMVCYGYSIVDGSIGTIFQLTVFDRYQEWGLAKINHLLKTGLMVIAIDRKTNLVAGSAAFFDLTDQYKNRNNQTLSVKLKHKKECSAYSMKAACEKNDELNKIFNNKIDEDELDVYFGRWVEGSAFTVRSDVKKTGLGMLLVMISTFAVIRMGYKYTVTRIANPRSLGFLQGAEEASDSHGYKYFSKFSLYDFVFSDGTKMEKYFDELETKWGYNQNQIKRLKKINFYTSIIKLPTFEFISDRMYTILKLYKSKL
eukprot:175029_1